MSVVFRNAATAAEVEVQNPKRGNTLGIDLRQVVNRTADGELNVYTLGPTETRVKLEWQELRQSEKDDLETFWELTAQGAAVLFLYRDHKGAWWNARFLNPSLEFTERDDYPVTTTGVFTSGGVSYPTTVREKGIWAVEVELLLTAQGSTTSG